jgi:hypothetical protein
VDGRCLGQPPALGRRPARAPRSWRSGSNRQGTAKRGQRPHHQRACPHPGGGAGSGTRHAGRRVPCCGRAALRV